MRKRWQWQEEAERDLERALAWYEQEAGRAAELQSAVEQVIQALKRDPTVSTRIPGLRRLVRRSGVPRELVAGIGVEPVANDGGCGDRLAVGNLGRQRGGALWLVSFRLGRE